jgi:hypothetical protein
MAAVSNAGLLWYEIYALFSGFTGSIASSGPYQSGLEKGQYTFNGSAAQPLKLSVPAPIAAQFQADTLHINPSYSLAAALQAAMASHGCDRSGNPPLGFLSGIRKRGKGKRLSR